MKQLSKDEAKQVMSQPEFQQFLMKTSRYVERALGAEFDFKGEFFIDDEVEHNQDEQAV